MPQKRFGLYDSNRPPPQAACGSAPMFAIPKPKIAQWLALGGPCSKLGAVMISPSGAGSGARGVGRDGDGDTAGSGSASAVMGGSPVSTMSATTNVNGSSNDSQPASPLTLRSPDHCEKISTL